ncbi:endo alpha-1,4 polygalactosaminidase [Candidatus Villigracilis affinis]|uniref:endo alpha-1,4 polygalactosaminidase n=1 Tax=Candidatus Villigracilis affinis TaxID=3140682 RepID=UPI0031EB1FDE
MPSTSQPSTFDLTPETNWWHPTAGLTWQWQIGDLDIDTSIEADVYDIDLYVDQAIIDELHAKGRKVICYISVGSWEDWRPDKDQFPAEVLGKDYDGWPGEKWLDIRAIDKLAPIMLARLDLCKAKGFDALEPDNMEIYTNDTGFPLTYEDQLKFALWLADEAHKRGLAIGQKNASDQVSQLVDVYDFAITEDYFYYNEAESMLPYIQSRQTRLRRRIHRPARRLRGVLRKIKTTQLQHHPQKTWLGCVDTNLPINQLQVRLQVES